MTSCPSTLTVPEVGGIARGGRDEAGDDLHQRRLARAVGAEQSDDTFINSERHVVEGELFSVLLGDMVD